ncbi:MAG: 6-hydroxymethylpterin diphosphokinase MptE-like protein [Conexivisphaerales archaeon]
MDGQYFYLNNWDAGLYFDIANQLRLNIGKDYMSSSYFNRLIDVKPILALEKIINQYGGKKVLVLGAGPSLETNIKSLMEYSILNDFITIAADGASYALKKIADINPNFIVTDLDGYPEEEVKMSNDESVAVVHSHGDNINLLSRYVHQLKNLIGTTQCEPLGKLYNFGGFTDGDRSVYFANTLNPKMIVLVGMDFGDKIGNFSNALKKDKVKKIIKLKIGKKLLERFAMMHANSLDLYDMTSAGNNINGFKKIKIDDMVNIIKGR